MKAFSIAALGIAAVSAGGALASPSAPDPTVTPLTYAGPQLPRQASLLPVGTAFEDRKQARAYEAERARLLDTYLALEEANGGALRPEERAAMRRDIADLKGRFAIP